MSSCCPPRLGCNAPRRDEPCVLDLCRAITGREPGAATALARWQSWQEAIGADRPRSELRFQRRAYERAREAAMGVLVMTLARRRPRQGSGRAGRRAGPSCSPAGTPTAGPPVRLR
jgi:hypothetical protein